MTKKKNNKFGPKPVPGKNCLFIAQGGDGNCLVCFDNYACDQSEEHRQECAKINAERIKVWTNE